MARLRWPGFAGLTALAALVLAVFGVGSRPAQAHPLGNFTINHYDRIEVTASGIEVYSVLDMAEVPTVRAEQDIDTDDDGVTSFDEESAYAQGLVEELRDKLTLRVNGDFSSLVEVSHDFALLDGDAGLRILRLVARHRADLPDDWRESPPSIEFENAHLADRVGWREIIVLAGPGVELQASSVPSVDVSRELRAYPDGFGSPLDVRSATFTFVPGVGAPLPTVDPDVTTATRGNPDGTLERYAALVSKDELGFGVVVLALLAAMGFGAIHALSPGHGKTIVAAYLVGSRGTWKHALLLGLVVTATHTSSVYAIGFITLYLSDHILPEDLYPWLGLASGAIVLAMGAALLWGRLRDSGLFRDGWRWLRSRVAAQPRAAMSLATAGALASSGAGDGGHDHPHDDAHYGAAHHGAVHYDDQGRAHDHDHDGEPHKHGFGPAHSHKIPGQDGEPVTWQRLVGLGMFGGMIPCPSAIVVMLGAVSEHRVGFGLFLILSFSIGLAGVLTGIGFAVVFAGALTKRVPVLARVGHRVNTADGWQRVVVRALPVAAAFAVVVAGTVITVRALDGF